MRLINTTTRKLEEFTGQPPPYAILSHMWGEEEVSFASFQNPLLRRAKKGFRKINKTCKQAKKDGLGYAWIDTCCIDKTNSAELSEAINSMFAWYRGSETCYAYLEDVTTANASEFERHDSPLARSRWFRRGWTLQELVAPRRVEFYNRDWKKIDEKSNRTSDLRNITGIWDSALQGAPLSSFCVGVRMSWATDRQTTRIEDIAYSLLGIFDINIALIYGEGPKAFLRLQEEIIRQYNDHTIFAWRDGNPGNEGTLSGLLATSPSEFAGFRSAKYYRFRGESRDRSSHIRPLSDFNGPQTSFSISSNGVDITAMFRECNSHVPGQRMILVLNCCNEYQSDENIGIFVERIYGKRYARVEASKLANCPPGGQLRTVCLARTAHEARALEFTEPWLRSPLTLVQNISSNSTMARLVNTFEYGFFVPRAHQMKREDCYVHSIADVTGGRWHRVQQSTEHQDSSMLLSSQPKIYLVFLKSQMLGQSICVDLSQKGAAAASSSGMPTARMRTVVYDGVPGSRVVLYQSDAKILQFPSGTHNDNVRISQRAPVGDGLEVELSLRPGKLGPLKVWIFDFHGPYPMELPILR